MRDNWDWEEIKGEPLGGWSGPARTLPPSRYPRRWLRQAVVAGLLWLGITLLFRLEGPGVQQLQVGLRHYLADPTADYTAVVASAVRSGMWMDAYDRWVFHTLKNPAAAVPTTANPSRVVMALPLSGQITRPYGRLEEDNQQYFHNGIDIRADGETAVRAALDGRVVRVGEDPVLGLVVEIDHGQGLVTVYGTLGQVKVTRGQEVSRGTVIATLTAGRSARLHFEVRQDGQAVDPAPYLGAQDKI
ncbi:stage II sporulation protein Q [Moorella thermoacetica]|uniref:Stage II sporulation protein Q n=1 Tax=Neomoorella thermoacetica TaxID=1525 RepID=A0A1J5JGE2_NEOTH|nr:M23 family metallopeptidase [Moorella thermoacetica]OIQ08602.1 stage II sporulation protein Q [Moorella thermoacetica]